MGLIFEVQMEEWGTVSEDDGESVWHATTIRFGCGTAGIISDVLVDAYSGAKRATINRDDFGLPPRLAEPLALAIYRSCGVEMRRHDCDFGIAVCDVDSLVARNFYHTDAQTLLRKVRATVSGMKQSTPIGTAP